MGEDWPLIGRDGELRTARTALEGAGVVICSPWGMGAAAFARAVAPRAWARVLVAPAMRTQPSFAIRTLLGTEVDGADPAAAARTLRSDLDRVGGRPVLVVEGFDHLDDASASVLIRLVDEGVLRLVGVREGIEPVAAAEAATWRSVGLTRVDLAPLADDAMDDLVEVLVGGPIEGRTRQELVAVAAGCPQLAHEVIDASRRSAALVIRGGLWRLDDRPTLPPAALDRARAALAQLDPAGLAAAEVLAVSGPLPAAVLGAAADPAGLESLERAGLAAASEAAPGALTLRLADPVVVAHLARAVPATARLRIAAALADATEALDAADDADLFVRSTEWALQAGRDPGADRLLHAARAAIELGDPARAERLAAASSAARPSTEAVLLESWCADESGAVERSERVLLDHRPEGDEAIVALAVRRAEQRYWTHRDPAAAAELLGAARAEVEAPWDSAVDAQAAMFDLLDGRTARALAVAEPLVGHGTRMVASTAGLTASLSLVIDDRPVEAIAIAEDALAALAGPAPALSIDPGVHIISLGFGFEGAGRWHEADDLTTAVYQHALSRPGRQAQGWAALLRARVLTACGRPAAAVAVALEAEEIWRRARVVGVARWSATVAAQAAACCGEVDLVADALARIDADDSVPFRLFEPEVERVRTWAACLGTDRAAASAARARLAESARAAADDGRRSLAVLAAFDLVRLGDAALGAELLGDLVDDRSSAPSRLRADVADALVRGDGAALEDLADRWEEAGASGTAAECLAFASSVRPARAPALAGRIDQLVAGTGLCTPPIQALRSVRERQQLTPREQEIVAMVADGLSNRAIADQLVVSTRTVENHLHRAYAKLGVSSRAELLAAPPG